MKTTKQELSTRKTKRSTTRTSARTSRRNTRKSTRTASSRKPAARGAETDAGGAVNPAHFSARLLQLLLHNEAFSPDTAMSAKAIAAELGTEADVICYLAKQLAGPGFAVFETENATAPLVGPFKTQCLYIETNSERVQALADRLAADANLMNERVQLCRAIAQIVGTGVPSRAARPAG